MLSEAAATLGITSYQLRKWISDEKDGYTPSRKVMFGKTQIYLYTTDDLERIKALYVQDRAVQTYDGKRGLGRPRKYSDATRKERGRLQSRRYYWKVRLEEAMFRRDIDLMGRAKSELEKIDTKLKGQESGSIK